MQKHLRVLAAGLLVTFGVVLFPIVVGATPRTVSHDAVTTYTDNTLIEGSKTVLYSVWYQDTVTSVITQVVNKVPALSHGFNDNVMVKGRLYNFYGQTWLSTGESSANSPNFGWPVPLGVPKMMGGWIIN